MSKDFDTINIHTLIRTLLQTKIPGTLNKFIANYIKRRKAYTTYINHTSSQRQFKTVVPQGGTLSPTLFNIYTADIPPPRHRFRSWPMQMTSHHIYTHKHECSKEIHKVFSWTKQSNLTLNPDKTTCTLFTPDPAEYKSNLSGPKNKQHCTTHGNATKGSGHYLRPKTHLQHRHSQHFSTSHYK